jgi:hypothetical protein
VAPSLELTHPAPSTQQAHGTARVSPPLVQHLTDSLPPHSPDTILSLASPHAHHRHPTTTATACSTNHPPTLASPSHTACSPPFTPTSRRRRPSITIHHHPSPCKTPLRTWPPPQPPVHPSPSHSATRPLRAYASAAPTAHPCPHRTIPCHTQSSRHSPANRSRPSPLSWDCNCPCIALASTFNDHSSTSTTNLAPQPAPRSCPPAPVCLQVREPVACHMHQHRPSTINQNTPQNLFKGCAPPQILRNPAILMDKVVVSRRKCISVTS